MTRATPQVTLDGGRLAIAWPDGLATTGPIAARVLLTNGEEALGESWRRDGDGFAVTCGPTRIRLTASLRRGAIRLQLTATAVADADVAELGIICHPEVAKCPPTWLVQNGYQSWDATGVVPATGAGARPSWWTIGVADDAGNGLAAVALSGRRTATRFGMTGTRLIATACEPAGLTQHPLLWRARRDAPRWAAEPLLLTASNDVRQALAAGARAAARTARVPDHVPQGWLSWYHFGPWIEWEDMIRNADAIATGSLKGLGYRYLQLDDGWQQAYGDWTANIKFERGLDTLAAEAAERGLVLGIWTAPFLVSESSHIGRTAPDNWFIKVPATGARAVDPVHTAFGPMYMLDARQPAVRRHLRQTFAALYDAGIRYFKIDFLYAGAYGSIKALRQGVETIRQAVRDSYLLACGAPLLPMVGLADGCRIGRDTATPVYDFERGAPAPALLGEEIADVGSNLAARHFLAPWFQLDPDVALVGGNLTLDQARTCVTFCALSGGPFFASDDLAGLPEDRRALLADPQLLELVGRGPAVPDWLPSADGSAPPVWRQDGSVAVFNWSGAPSEVAVDLDGRRETVAIPPGGVRLLRSGQG